MSSRTIVSGRVNRHDVRSQALTVQALILGIGFWGILYYAFHKEQALIVLVIFLGPYSTCKEVEEFDQLPGSLRIHAKLA